MSKHRIVSFFATEPGGGDFPTTDYGKTADGSIDPTFLPEVWAALKAKGAKPMGPPTDLAKLPHHMMVRVPSVKKMGAWLSLYSLLATSTQSLPMLRVQVIGHSESGQMALGGGWKQQEPKWKPPFLWFDSNPRSLQSLSLPGLVHEVMLAGCYIAQRLSNLNAVNGRTLLFAISELWRCRARGAQTSVNPEDFDSEGWYKGVPGGRPIGWSWKTRTTTFADLRDTRWSPKPAKVALPTALTSKDRSVTDPVLIAKFCRYFDAQVPAAQQPRAALPDLTMTLSYGATRTPAYLVGNATFLIIGDDADRRYYTNARRRYSNEVAQVVSKLSPPPTDDHRGG